MPTWKSAAQITARYAVSESRLSDYSFRGNLPMMRQPDGSVFYDETEVAQLFPARSGIFSVPTPKGPHLGLLGVARMGDEPATLGGSATLSTLNPRERRRRAVRLEESGVYEGIERRKTGTHG